MFERMLKPFLTAETGEAYQPIRLTYEILDKEELIATLNQLQFLEAKPGASAWNCYWRDEANDLHFESLESYKRNPEKPVRLATFNIQANLLYVSLSSFKRACLLVPLLYKLIAPSMVTILKADFINKVFGLNERLPHGFSELFKEEELEQIVRQRIEDYDKVQSMCEDAQTADEAIAILSNYTKSESSKRLPYAERYSFSEFVGKELDPEVAFLGFYIFLRGRELVAIRRWFGETGYSLADAAEETLQQVFGNMDIDIID